MRITVTTTLFMFSMAASALTPTPNDQASVDKVFINANIHVGNGEVLKNAQFGISAGKITRAGHYKMAYDGSEINLKGAHIYPGFILTNTDLGLTEVDSFKATRDNSETGQLNPNVRSIVAYNTDSERLPTMRFNGILLAQPTPSGGLVSGTSSVVQLDAWNWEDAAVKIDDGLHVNWPAEWVKKFDFSTFTVQLKQDEKYLEKVAEIKSLFADAQSTQDANNLKLNAVNAVFGGKTKLFLHADDPKSIVEGINYFQSIGLKNTVLVTGQGAEKVIDFIKASGVSVVVESVHSLPHLSDDSVDATFALPAQLTAAGILTAITYPGSMSSRNLAFTAGTSVAYGNTTEQALSMITLNPAKILGIDADYGSLEIGKSATFFISNGDALDMRGNVIQEAYIDGRPIELHTQQQQLNDRFSKKYQD